MQGLSLRNILSLDVSVQGPRFASRRVYTLAWLLPAPVAMQQQQSALAERDTLLHRKPATAGTAVSPSSSGPVTVTASGDSLAKLDRLDKRSDERFGKHDRGYAIDPVRRGRRRLQHVVGRVSTRHLAATLCLAALREPC